jgi:YD repeat-containing protein
VLNGGDTYFRAFLTNLTSPLYIADADGTVYSFSSSGTHKGTSGLANIYSSIASSIEDRNGNVVTLTDLGSQHSGSFTVTDTLGRTVMSTSGFGSSGDSLSISGLDGSYVVDWGAIASGPPVAVGATLLYNGQGLCSTTFPSLSEGGSTEINTITLPNNKSYEFSYDPSYGLLTKITYPSGGYIKYVWGLNTLSEFDSLEDTDGGRNNCLWHHDTPVVVNRSVSFDGVKIALQQTFSYSTNWSSNTNSWTTKTTTVTTTDNISGLVDTKVYTYSPVTMPAQPNDFQIFAPQVPVEQTVVTKNSTNTTLRTVSKTWLNQYELASVTTALNDGASVPTSEVTYNYGSGAQVTDKKEYDYGSGAPGNLLRETVTNYQVFGDIPLFATAPSIFDRPCQVITYNGGRNRYAETDAYYDNGATGTPCSAAGTPSITGVSGLTSHDETYYSASSKSARGNATTIVKQCFQGSTACASGNPTTAYTYDETGQALSITDPNRNTTSYSYSDSFVNTNSSRLRKNDGAAQNVVHVTRLL